MHHLRALALGCSLCLTSPATAADWPMYRCDPARSGVSSEQLDAPRLVESWRYEAAERPHPAWPGPAKWDAYASLRDLKSMRNYDPVFHPIVVAGKVYYGSSVDDSVHQLDLETGEPGWRFTTDGPVRIAPTHSLGRLYFGSDDGHAYCLEAVSGEEIWRFSPSEHEMSGGRLARTRRVLNNGRLIPFWPVRTGVVVADDTAYFGASFLPWKTSLLCAVDAETGEPTGAEHYVRQLGLEHTLEGALLASGTTLVVPQGRVPPTLFDRRSGESLGSLAGGGGSFVLLTDDDRIMHGPGNKKGWITDSKTGTRAKVASYDRGNEVLVDGDVAYLLRDKTLGAMQRSEPKLLWMADSSHPYAMIKAGRTIFAGGYDQVGAYDAQTGTLLWNAPVDGRAYGLAASEGRLVVSTDRGVIHCFAPAAADEPVPDLQLSSEPDGELAPEAPKIPAIDTRGLLDRWVFQSDRFTGGSGSSKFGRRVLNLAEGPDAEILGEARLEYVGPQQALLLDGENSGVQAAADFKSVRHPKRELTASAWVRIDAPTEWGGLVSITQDNGAYERGWMLGYRRDRFGFAVKGVEGAGNLTWITSPQPFQPGEWHHVAATYDGATMVLYVDGEPVAESRSARGDIMYPEHAYYHLAAYRDDDEHFRLRGMLNEVRVYERALPASEVGAAYAGKAGQFPVALPVVAHAENRAGVRLKSGPELRFLTRDSAVIRWETAEPSSTVLKFWFGEEPRVFGSTRLTRRHEVRIPDLREEVEYRYQIEQQIGGDTVSTEPYLCDTTFNYRPLDVSKALASLVTSDSRRVARALLRQASLEQGLCVVLGATDGALIAALLELSGLRIIAFDTDPAVVAQLRRRLLDAGAYGTRVAVHQVDSLETLDCPQHLANLVCSERQIAGEEIDDYASLARGLIEPGNGVSATMRDGAWSLERKPEFAGSQDWRHMYGLANNSAYTGEALADARGFEEMEVQWVGRPGPRYQSDRGNRKPAPLSTDGKLFLQGLLRVIAADAFNGSILWSVEIPEFRRFNIPRDTGNWCADDEHLLLTVGGECWRLDVDTGEIVAKHEVLPAEREDWEYDWGYLARAEDLLLGSAVKRDTSYVEWWGAAHWYDGKDAGATAKVCSDRLFALRNGLGAREVWSYEDGLIINPTITIADGCAYFLEIKHPALKVSAGRRVSAEEMWEHQELVALDLATGRKVYSKRLQQMPGRITLYMAASEGRLIVVASDAGKFGIYCYDADSGEPVWDRLESWEVDHHGKHLSRPTIVEGEVVIRPYTFRLADGAMVDRPFPRGHQCGSYCASKNAIILRAGQLAMWDRIDGGATRLNRARPDCWISTIPAQGLMLSPEGGGGCSCGSWLETSFVMIPKVRERE